jgi:hypothetical protein
MNMAEVQVVTLGFNKENPKNFPTPSSQQSRSQPTKVTPLKAKGAKLELGNNSTSYLVEQGGEEKCLRCGRPHKKKECSNPA